jgi:hypothetical protein
MKTSPILKLNFSPMARTKNDVGTGRQWGSFSNLDAAGVKNCLKGS